MLYLEKNKQFRYVFPRLFGFKLTKKKHYVFMTRLFSRLVFMVLSIKLFFIFVQKKREIKGAIKG